MKDVLGRRESNKRPKLGQKQKGTKFLEILSMHSKSLRKSLDPSKKGKNG